MEKQQTEIKIQVNENLFLDTKNEFLKKDILTAYKTDVIEPNKRYCFKDKGKDSGFTMFYVCENKDSFFLYFNDEKGCINNSDDFVVHVYKRDIQEVLDNWDLYKIDSYSRSMDIHLEYVKTQNN